MTRPTSNIPHTRSDGSGSAHESCDPNWHSARNSYQSGANPNYPSVFTSSLGSIVRALRARVTDIREALHIDRPSVRRPSGRSSHSQVRVHPLTPHYQAVSLSLTDIEHPVDLVTAQVLAPRGVSESVISSTEPASTSALGSSVNQIPEQTPESRSPGPGTTNFLPLGSLVETDTDSQGDSNNLRVLSRSSSATSRGSGFFSNRDVIYNDDAGSGHSTPFAGLRATRNPELGSRRNSAQSSPPSSPLPVFDRLSPDSPPGLSRLVGQGSNSLTDDVYDLDNRSEAASVGACGLPAALIKIINNFFHDLRF